MSKFQRESRSADQSRSSGKCSAMSCWCRKAREQQREATEPETGPIGGHDQGIVRDERGQEQPRDKERAQRVSRVDRGDDPPGKKKKG